MTLEGRQGRFLPREVMSIESETIVPQAKGIASAKMLGHLQLGATEQERSSSDLGGGLKQEI